jgi:hypothetical protein
VREIVEIFLVHLTSFMGNGDPVLSIIQQCSMMPYFKNSKQIMGTFLHTAIVLYDRRAWPGSINGG